MAPPPTPSYYAIKTRGWTSEWALSIKERIAQTSHGLLNLIATDSRLWLRNNKLFLLAGGSEDRERTRYLLQQKKFWKEPAKIIDYYTLAEVRE